MVQHIMIGLLAIGFVAGQSADVAAQVSIENRNSQSPAERESCREQMDTVILPEELNR